MNVKTPIRERPVLFAKGPVRAIVDGRMTQMRRVMKWQPIIDTGGTFFEYSDRGLRGVWTNELRWDDRDRFWVEGDNKLLWRRCPYGRYGERLWVREDWRYAPRTHSADRLVEYRAPSDAPGGWKHPHRRDPVTDDVHWQSPIRMPRWAARITLEITDIRVDRVQTISEEDVIAEGMTDIGNRLQDARGCHNTVGVAESYRQRWDSSHAWRGYSWATNPWVWIVTFRRLTHPEGYPHA